jgi:hypothetical protein
MEALSNFLKNSDMTVNEARVGWGEPREPQRTERHSIRLYGGGSMAGMTQRQAALPD